MRSIRLVALAGAAVLISLALAPTAYAEDEHEHAQHVSTRFVQIVIWACAWTAGILPRYNSGGKPVS